MSVSNDQLQTSDEKSDVSAPVLVRELDVDAIARDANVIAVGPRRCGKTEVVASLVTRLEFKNVCVATDSARNRYASTFGGDHVHPLADNRADIMRQREGADCLILDGVVRAIDVRGHVHHAHGKFCIVSTQAVTDIRPDVRGNADLVVVGKTSFKKEVANLFRAWPIPDFDEARWCLLLSAVTATRGEPHRFLVMDRTPEDGVQLSWYRAPWPPAPPKSSPSENKGAIQSDRKTQVTFLPRMRFPVGLCRPLLPIALMSHVALMLRVRDAIRLYTVNTTMYRHSAAHLRRVPTYECRTRHTGNIILVTTRPTPMYDCP